MMTQRVSASEQGELQGALSSLRGLAMIFGPGIFSATFAACIRQGRSFPAGPWYLAAFILLVALALAVKVTGGASATGNSRVEQESTAG
jgi:DHA1 family tetracycline resistance protein-like MFS transporter